MTENEQMVDVGAGRIDFKAIFGRAEQAGLEHFFVEHDEPEDPLASIKASHDYLEALRF
jgi:sugar phosphate isomerase/epimerase